MTETTTDIKILRKLPHSFGYPVVRQPVRLGQNMEIAIDCLISNGYKEITLVGTGTSGASIATAMVLRSIKKGINVQVSMVTKSGESCHRANVHPTPHDNDTLVVVDDLMESGNTMRNIASRLGEYARQVKVVVIGDICTWQKDLLLKLFPELELIITAE